MPALAVIPAIDIRSMYSTISGPDPAGHDRGHRRGDLPRQGGERRQQGGVVLGSGVQPEHGPGHQGQRALRSDDQLGEVVAAGRLHELAAGGDHLAGAEDGLDAEDMVAGHAVLDRPHPAGVGGHVAPEAGRLLAGEHRVDETVGPRAASSSARVTPGSTTATWLAASISRMRHIRSKETTIPVGHRDAAHRTARYPSRGR